MSDSRTHCNRRSFLKICAGASAALITPSYAAIEPQNKRKISLFNIRTNERISTTYWTTEGYRPDALQRINHLLRDHRTGDIEEMDPELIDLLHAIHRESGGHRDLHVISGYRSPKTNSMLRKRNRRVAKKSYHMHGMAVDIRIPEMRTKNLRKMALAQKAGGVGYYPRSGFVHVDTGPVRTW